MSMGEDMLCKLNAPEAIHALIRAGLSDVVIERLLSSSGGECVTRQSIRKNRNILKSRGEVLPPPRRCQRVPHEVLIALADVRYYSTAVSTYFSLTARRDSVDPRAMVTAYRTLTAYLESVAPGSSRLEINDFFSVLNGLLAEDVCYRKCPQCGTWSLLALNAPRAMAHCPFCSSQDIRSGEVWFISGDNNKAS